MEWVRCDCVMGHLLAKGAHELRRPVRRATQVVKVQSLVEDLLLNFGSAGKVCKQRKVISYLAEAMCTNEWAVVGWSGAVLQATRDRDLHQKK